MRHKTLLTGSWERKEVKIHVSDKAPAWPDKFFLQAEMFWQEALKSKKILFNGKLSSLISAQVDDGKLELILGEICYRDQMFSNKSMQDWLPDEKEKYAACGLGISAVVETLDQQVLMILRSQFVCDHANFYDVIGGHVHPENHAKAGTPDVFFAIEDEIHCELGVDFQDIKDTVCIGLIENTEWLKPELVFISNLNLTKTEVLKCARKAEERFEYSAIKTFPATVAGISAFREKYSQQCTPSAEGCLELYQNHPTKPQIPWNRLSNVANR